MLSIARNLAAVIHDWVTPAGGSLTCGRCPTRHAGWKAFDAHVRETHPEIAAEERRALVPHFLADARP